MSHQVESDERLSNRELDEFWQVWSFNRLKEEIKEEIAKNGRLNVADLDPHDRTFWLRVALAL